MPDAWLDWIPDLGAGLVPGGWLLLAATTAGVAAVHTVIGPDHWLPFVAMVRAGQWTRARALRIAALCGLGHVASSIALGAIGAALGVSLVQVSGLDSLRGAIAAWALILFGAGYAAWGLRRGLRARAHSHWHAHADGRVHAHEHVHASEHVHFHEPRRVGAWSAWSLFAIFILGPCEPLIPLMLAPAAAQSAAAVVGVVAVFTVVTLGSMLALVWLGASLPRGVAVPGGARFGHAAAGGLVCGCGLLMAFAGL